MSIEVLKQEWAGLGAGEQNSIMAFLAALQDERTQGYREALARRTDDRDPAKWVDLDEFDRRCGSPTDRVP